MAGVRIKLDQKAIRKMQMEGGDVDSAVRKAAGITRDRAKQNITADGRVDTGRLRNSIITERRSRSDRLANYAVGSPLDYAIYQEEGTRAHGPRRAKVMRFRGRNGAFVFTKWVRGVTPSRFLQRALNAIKVSDFS